jgi:hypothetical protein
MNVKFGNFGTVNINVKYAVSEDKRITVAYISEFDFIYMFRQLAENMGILSPENKYELKRLTGETLHPEMLKGIVRWNPEDKYDIRVAKREAFKKIEVRLINMFARYVNKKAEGYNKFIVYMNKYLNTEDE